MAGITNLLSDPFYEGADPSVVLSNLPVALGSHRYDIDPQLYRRTTVPPIRQAIDSSTEPGEQTVNPEVLWPRSQSTWHLGAGQEYLDREDSVRSRFDQSLHLDPWDRNLLSLLPATEQFEASTDTNLQLLTAGDRLYRVEGQYLEFTTDPDAGTVSWTAVTGLPSTDIVTIATDGTNVYVVYPTEIYKTDTSSSAGSSWATGLTNMQSFAFANGFLIGGDGATLLEFDAAGMYSQAGQLDYDHVNTSAMFSHVTGSSRGIFAAATVGGRSDVFFTEVDSSGALTAPKSAMFLPDGETVTALTSYGDVLLLGTTKGVRVGQVQSTGAVAYGPVIEVTNPVQCFEPQEDFVWFGWSDFDASHTGLGRLHLSQETATLVPAYATDLMATDGVSGAVTSVVTFGSKRYFAVSEDGFYRQTDDLEATGWIDVGLIDFNISADKISSSFSFKVANENGGSIQVLMTPDIQTQIDLGTVDLTGNTGPVTPLAARRVTSEVFSLRLVFSRNSSDTTLGPDLSRWTFQVVPVLERMDEIQVPIRLFEKIEDRYGRVWRFNTRAEFDHLKSLEANGITIYQEGRISQTVSVRSVEMRPHKWDWNNNFFEGICMVTLVTVKV